MSDLIASIGWTITGIATLVCLIQVPALILFFGLIFGVMFFINPKL